MNDLYNADLFLHDITSEGRNFKTIVQIFIAYESLGFYLGIAKTGDSKEFTVTDSYILFQLIEKEKAIFPIPSRHASKIVEILKMIPFDIKPIFDIVHEIPDDKKYPPNGNQAIRLSKRLSCYIGNSTPKLRAEHIELKFSEQYCLLPNVFCFYCYDGLRYKIFSVITEYNNEHLQKWHLLSGIELFVSNEFQGIYYPSAVSFSENMALSIQGETYESALLTQSYVGKLKYTGSTLFDITDFILSQVGLYDRVKLPSRVRNVYRWFSVIIPIEMLHISEEFGIGCVSFINRDNNEVKRLIEYSTEQFEQYEAFACVHINEDSIYKAFESGKQQIQRSLDFLCNLLRSDSIFSNHGFYAHPINKVIDHFESSLCLSSWVYIDIPFTHEKIVCNYANPIENKGVFVSSDLIKELCDSEKVELQLIRISKVSDKLLSPLYDALKWIRKAWDSIDNDDQIIYSVIALEFLVAGEKSAAIFDKEHRELIANEFEIIVRNHCVENIAADENFISDVLKKFHYCYTDTPFMQKLNNLIQRLNMPVTTREMALIKKAREKRNDIIHGRKSASISRQEIRLLCQTISVIAIYKINSLEYDV